MSFELRFAALNLIGPVAIVCAPQLAMAQNIQPDNTLGTLVDTPGCVVCTITGGVTQNVNLFHSFEEFSISNGGEAFFDAAPAIENIFARVTGITPSEINGSIATNDAGLMLLNPNGIVFLDNAQLNVEGSFVATSANSVDFGREGQFSVDTLQVPSLLTVTAPIGLGFGIDPGAIEVLPSLSAIDPVALTTIEDNTTLALIGGELFIEFADLFVESGRIELGSVAGESFVEITSTDQGWEFDYSQVQTFQDIQMFLSLIGDEFGGSSIQIQGNNISIEASAIFSDVEANSQSGQQIAIIASNELFIDESEITTATYNTNKAGDIFVKAANLVLDNQSIIFSPGLVNNRIPGSGAAGNIFIQVDDTVGLFGASIIASDAEIGDGGTVTVEANQLEIEEGSSIGSRTFGAGNAGDLTVTITDEVVLIGASFLDGEFPSGLFTQVEDFATGNAGQLTLTTRQLTLLDGAQISASALGSGLGGDVVITATDSILISGTAPEATPLGGSSGIFTSAEPGSTEAGGNLTINTSQLTVENGARISADTLGAGPAGAATLNVDRLIVQGGGTVRSGSLQADGFPTPMGDGNTLTVNATESIEVSGTGTIGTDFPVDSEIVAAAEGTGDAGQLNLSTPLLIISDGGNVRTNSVQTSGGQITIQVDVVQLLGDGDIITAVDQGRGTGGNILIVGDSVVATGDSDILAFANEGTGGNITLPAFFGDGVQPNQVITNLDDLNALDGNDRVDVNATGELASGAIVFPDVSFIENSLTELPDAPIDTETLVASSCIAPTALGSGRLVITGADNIPQQPGSTGVSTIPTGTIRNLPSETTAADEADGWAIGDPIAEPQGFYQVGDGRVVLSRDCL